MQLAVALFDTEEPRFGWYTAVRIVNAMAKRRFSFDKSDGRLCRLLELLATAVEQDSMGSRVSTQAIIRPVACNCGALYEGSIACGLYS